MAIDLNRANEWETAREYLADLPSEIVANGEGESMFSIVPNVISFGYSGGNTQELMRLCIKSLLDAGAAPVLFATSGNMQWVEQNQYGATNEEKASAIVSEWVEKGMREAGWDDLWFVSRKVLETTKR